MKISRFTKCASGSCGVLFLISSLMLAADDENPFECRHDCNQQEMNACAVRDYEVADKALNDEYRSVMRGLPTERQKLLRQQQRAWLKDRDPQCKDEARPSEGGSIWPIEFYACLQAATEKRTLELVEWPARE